MPMTGIRSVVRGRGSRDWLRSAFQFRGGIAFSGGGLRNNEAADST
jgi:hypothetical protein